MDYKTFLKYWTPLIIYASLIFFISSQPQQVVEGFLNGIEVKDKIFHIVEFFILSIFIFRLLEFYQVKHRYIITIIISTMYGVTDEIHQLFVPGKYYSILDIVANFLGSTVILMYHRFTFKQKK